MNRGKKYRQEEIEGHAKHLGYNVITYGEEVPFSRIMVLNQVLGKENPRNTSIISVLVEIDIFGNKYVFRIDKPNKNQMKLWNK